MQAIKNALATIEQKLPFLISLTDAERKQLFKIGPERLSFAQNAAQGSLNNPSIPPGQLRREPISIGGDALWGVDERQHGHGPSGVQD